eukprot:gene2842-3442_t
MNVATPFAHGNNSSTSSEKAYPERYRMASRAILPTVALLASPCFAIVTLKVDFVDVPSVLAQARALRAAGAAGPEEDIEIQLPHGVARLGGGTLTLGEEDSNLKFTGDASGSTISGAVQGFGSALGSRLQAWRGAARLQVAQSPVKTYVKGTNQGAWPTPAPGQPNIGAI